MKRRMAFTPLDLASANAVFEYQAGPPKPWGCIRHTTHDRCIPRGHKGEYITEANNTVVHTVKVASNDDIEGWLAQGSTGITY